MRVVVFFLSLTLSTASVLAQPANGSCANAQQLCAEQPANGNNTGAPNLPWLCGGEQSSNQVWYTFMTNSVGGQVFISVGGIDCPQLANTGNMVSATVLSGDGSCNLATFSPVPPCMLDSEDFVLTTGSLLPSTRYWLIIGGAFNGGAASAAQCAFNVEVSGPGANVIGVDFSAGNDVTIGEGESTQLEATGPVGSTFTWTPTTGLSNNTGADPIAAPAASTNYTVSVSIGGCNYSDEVMVNIIRRILPTNTFTPNDDGKNDLWEIPGINDYPGAEVVVHDRWGQVVYRSNGYREPWDGTNGGRKLSEGTYYYYIQLNQLQGQGDPYLGFVSIVR